MPIITGKYQNFKVIIDYIVDSRPVYDKEDPASNPETNNQDFWLEKLHIVLFTEINCGENQS